MNKLRGKNVTFFMEDELDEYSINLTTWNAANGLFCETADELSKSIQKIQTRVKLTNKRFNGRL